MSPQRARHLRRSVLAGVLTLVLFGLSQPATAADVIKNEDIGCFLDPGDIPGLPGFGLPDGTLVLRADGGVTVACHGWLPGGLTMSRTFAGTAPCFSPEGRVVTAHIVATKSGRVHFVCVFPKEK